MSEKQYKSNIESALQNVLSQVKNPTVEKEEDMLPSARLRKPRPIKARTVQNKTGPFSSEQTQTSTDPTVDAPLSASPTSTVTERLTEHAKTDKDSDPSVYLEGADLFTPNVFNKEDEEEEADLIEDIYESPYNLFEEFVETELNILLARYLDICRCSQCRADMVALALQQLPAYYVTGTRGTLTAKSVVWTRYMQQVMDAVTKSIHIVYKRPRSNCKKIRHVIWVKPDLEEVNSQVPNADQEHYFGSIHQEDMELEFSDEVAEIIQTLEASGETDLLPVSSPIVPKAPMPEMPIFPDKTKSQKSQLNPEGDSDFDMQLLDIDDWSKS